MQSTDFDLIKDIPGYKVILKTVLKKQIQQLVEQLADHTGEESVLLTASVSDGSLGHLGSESGKVFLQDHDDIKSQFLGFCLKRHHTQKQNENHQQQQRQSNVESYLTFTSMGPERRQSFPPLHAPQPPSLHIPMQFRNSSQFSSSPADIHPVALTLAQPQPVSKTGQSNARPEPYSKKRPRKKQERSRLSHQEFGSMKLPTELGTVKDKGASEVLVKVEVSDDQSDLSGVHSSDKSENSNHTGGNKSSSSKLSLATSRISLATSQVSLKKDSETNSSSSNIMNEAADDKKTIVEDISLDQGLVSLGDNMDEAGDTGSVSQGEISEVDPTADVKLECITDSDIELEITGEPGLMTNPDKNWASGGPPGVGSDKGQGQGQSYTGRSRRASTGGTQEFGKVIKSDRAMSRAEIQKAYRVRIKNDPVKYEAYLKKARDRKHKNYKPPEKLTPTELAIRKKKNSEYLRRHREKKRAQKDANKKALKSRRK